MQGEGEFDWDATTQSTILGSFYWCYILSQVVGGILTQHFGTKAVFGFSQLITALCSLLIPSAAPLHYGAVIALRSIQGVASVSYVTNVSISSLYKRFSHLHIWLNAVFQSWGLHSTDMCWWSTTWWHRISPICRRRYVS